MVGISWPRWHFNVSVYLKRWKFWKKEKVDILFILCIKSFYSVVEVSNIKNQFCKNLFVKVSYILLFKPRFKLNLQRKSDACHDCLIILMLKINFPFFIFSEPHTIDVKEEKVCNNLIYQFTKVAYLFYLTKQHSIW